MILSALTPSTGIVKSCTWLNGTLWISACWLLAWTSTTSFWSEAFESLACAAEKVSSLNLLPSRSSSTSGLFWLQVLTVVPMPWTLFRSARSYRFSTQLLPGWKKSARVSLRPAAEVSSGPPGLLDADEDDEVDGLVLVADVVLLSAELVELDALAVSESPAKLVHAAVLSSSPVDSRAVPSIRRVRPMIPRLPSGSPRRPRDRRVGGAAPLRRCPE